MKAQLAMTALALAAWMSFQASAAPLTTTTTPVAPEQGNPGLTTAYNRSANGITMTITQDPRRPNLIANWNSFDIGRNATVNIDQPTNGLLVNKVAGPMTTIAGAMNANARVYIINPAGIMVNAGATINAGALVLSALPLDETQLSAGRAVFTADGINTPGIVENHGKIVVGQPVQGDANTRTGGGVALIGRTVTNGADGNIWADGGTAALVAASKVELNFNNDNLTNVIVSRDALRVAGLELQADAATLPPSAAAEIIATAVNQDGVVRAHTVNAQGGRILLDAGTGATEVSNTLDATGVSGRGGNIDMTGGSVALGGGALVDASGAATSAQGVGGGRVRIGGPGEAALLAGTAQSDGLYQAGTVRIAQGAAVHADAIGTGAGGSVIVDGNQAVIAGALSATAGANAGNGGSIETSSPSQNLTGAQVSARAPNGTPGQWLIDPPGVDVSIVADAPLPASGAGGVRGAQTGAAAPLPQYGQISANAISAALSNGTSVTVRTNAASATGLGDGVAPPSGQITLDASIFKSAQGAPSNVALALQAYGGIAMSGEQRYTFGADPRAGALAMSFRTDYANAAAPSHSVYFSDAAFATNGGDFTVLSPSIRMNDVAIDTRASAQPATSGNVTMTADGNPRNSITLNASQITTSSGSIDMQATGGGIAITSDPYYVGDFAVTQPPPSVLSTGSGALRLYGSYAYDPQFANRTAQARAGVSVSNAALGTLGGLIDVRGLGLQQNGAGSVTGIGLDRATLTTAGGSDAWLALSGQGAGGGAGISARASTIGNPSQQGDIVLRAQGGANGSAFDPGTSGTENTFATQGNLVALPGGVNAGFTLADANTTPIFVGADAGGFSLTPAMLAQMRGADTVIVGSAQHAARITIGGTDPLPTNLTLENLGAGSAGIVADGGVNATGRMLTLASAGDVTIVGPVVADLLLLAGPGTFSLANAGNAVNMLAASNTGSVTFTNAHGFTIGAMRGVIFGAPTQPDSLGTIDASDTSVNGALLARALTGDIGLGGGAPQTHGIGGRLGASGAADVSVTARGPIDLVMDGTNGHFVNAGAGNIATTSGADAWRIWADTWEGEARGPVKPGGTLPDLYGCTYGGACKPDMTSNHFLYAPQPMLTVTIGDVTREQGTANPVFTWRVGGVRPGDEAQFVLTGHASTSAGVDAAPGKYPITGTFTSPAGYRVNVVGGMLTVLGKIVDPPSQRAVPGGLFGQSGLQTFYADTQRSFIYDSNLAGVMTRGAAGVCTGSNQPLASNLPADAAADALAVEWRRVRSQPNLNNCIIVNRPHGCGDF